MPKIFVSYRRIDSDQRAYAIADWLVNKYGKQNVFIDVDTIGGGDDFEYVIQNGLAQANVILIIIGHKWFDEFENRADNREKDFVYREVLYGLENIPTVIPILLERDIPLDENKLPPEIQPLLKRNFMVARKHPDFHRDMEEIKQVIDNINETELDTEPIKKQYNIPFLVTILVSIVIVAPILFTLLSNRANSANSGTNTPGNPHTAAVMFLTEQSLPTASPTENETATFDALLTELVQTATSYGQITISPYTETATNTVTNTVTDTPTPNLTETTLVLASTDEHETVAAQELTDEALTQLAQLTANAPTNTLQPTNTTVPPTSTMTNTPSLTPTETAIPPTATETPNLAATAQEQDNATATQKAFETQVVQTANAIDNARASETEQVRDITKTASASVIVNVDTANLRSGPGTNYSVAGTAQKSDEFAVIAYTGSGNDLWYLIDDEDESKWIWSGIVDLNGDESEIKIVATIPATPEVALTVAIPANITHQNFTIGQRVRVTTPMTTIREQPTVYSHWITTVDPNDFILYDDATLTITGSPTLGAISSSQTGYWWPIQLVWKSSGFLQDGWIWDPLLQAE